MSMVYIASPYAKLSKAEAISEARKASLQVKRMGFVPISTVLMWDDVYDEKAGDDRDRVIDAGLDVLSACEYIYVHKCDGWDESEGIKSELEYAKMKNIPEIEFEVLSALWEVRVKK